MSYGMKKMFMFMTMIISPDKLSGKIKITNLIFKTIINSHQIWHINNKRLSNPDKDEV